MSDQEAGVTFCIAKCTLATQNVRKAGGPGSMLRIEVELQALPGGPGSMLRIEVKLQAKPGGHGSMLRIEVKLQAKPGGPGSMLRIEGSRFVLLVFSCCFL